MFIAPSLVRTAVRNRPRAMLGPLRLGAAAALPTTSTTLPMAYRPIHASTEQKLPPKPANPGPKISSAQDLAPKEDVNVGQKRFADFDLKGKIFIVTGAARGLGLAMAEALVEAGGKVYCLDREEHPDKHFEEAGRRVVPEWGGALLYRRVDVENTQQLNELVAEIADENHRLDGVIAAAGIQQVTPAAEYTEKDASHMMAINYTGVLMTAKAAANQMFKYRCHGSICLIASMSGSVANKGMPTPVYNSSKAAVIQLARNLAMEWSPVKKDGTGGIRVNCISPGHIMTPMVDKVFEEVPGLRRKLESENMMGRLAKTTEFKGAALFLLSGASSYMTGNNLIIDGGHTSW